MCVEEFPGYCIYVPWAIFARKAGKYSLRQTRHPDMGIKLAVYDVHSATADRSSSIGGLAPKTAGPE
jgi:hypothetical protein